MNVTGNGLLEKAAEVRDKGTTGVLLSLKRGLRILEAIAGSNGAATAKWLSKETNIKIGTCYHILRTLEDDGYVVRLPGSRYGLGSRIAFLHDSFRAHLAPPQELLDVLSKLNEETGETSYISGWYGDNIVLQRNIEGSYPVHVRSLEIGYAGFAHARASGKGILAFLPEDRVRSYLSIQRMPRRTASTITDADAFIDHLREVAAQGYAVDREEFADGVSCVSAPIFDRSDFPIGAYTLSLPSGRFAKRLPQLIEAVKRAGINASVALGYMGPYPPASPLLND
jgi:DNA-binding IclR family transcriptional regulator